MINQVAAELRKTAAVCRKSYINPIVFDGWRSGAIHHIFGGSPATVSTRKAERLVLDFMARPPQVAGASPRRACRRVGAARDQQRKAPPR